MSEQVRKQEEAEFAKKWGNDGQDKNKPLTSNPLQALAAKGIQAKAEKIFWNEIVRLYDSFKTGGMTDLACSREIFTRGIPINRRGQPFNSSETLAASLGAHRREMHDKLSREEAAKAPPPPAPPGPVTELRSQIKNILTLPGLDDKTRLQVIRALVDA